MSRLLGFVLFAAALWVSAELYTNGVDGAFGGVLAQEVSKSEPLTRTQHAAGAFQRAYDSSEARVERALETPSE